MSIRTLFDYYYTYKYYNILVDLLNKECYICLDKVGINLYFLKCGHILCLNCYKKLLGYGISRCGICRKSFTNY
jgi:hypothetical protein